jgi:hypothetical protein
MPDSWLNEYGFPWMENARIPVGVDMQDSIENLKRFLFPCMVMGGVTLSGKLDDEFFAIFAINAFNNDRTGFSKILKTVMV